MPTLAELEARGGRESRLAFEATINRDPDALRLAKLAAQTYREILERKQTGK